MVDPLASSTKAPTEPQDDEQPKLRRELVALLFALAAAQIGILAAAVFQSRLPPGVLVATWTWRLAALSHLTLGLFVVSASWLGWSKSRAAAKEIDSVVDPDFWAALLDISLVIIYFILICSVEVVGSLDSKDIVVSPPSAIPESQWTVVAFLGYALWDIWTKKVCLRQRRKFVDWRGAHPVSKWTLEPIAWMTSSGTSAILAALVYWKACRVQSQATSGTWERVVLLDGALILLVFFFRASKTWEAWLFEDKLKWRPTYLKAEHRLHAGWAWATLGGAMLLTVLA